MSNGRLNLQEILQLGNNPWEMGWQQEYWLGKIGHGRENGIYDPYAFGNIVNHIQEIEKNGKSRKIAIFDTSLRMQVIKRGKKWFETHIPGVKYSKSLVEISQITEILIPWKIYEFAGRVEIDCTFINFRKIWMYPSVVR